MPSPTRSLPSQQPRWEVVALQLEAHAQGPTAEQAALAETAGLDLPDNIPAFVAAVVLKHQLQHVLFDKTRTGAEIPEQLRDLEDELGIGTPASLITNSREEVSAWFAARYAIKTAIGLRTLRPEPEDIVFTPGLERERRLISSIGSDGRVHMKGRPPRRAWPNYLQVDIRAGEPGHLEAAREIDANLRNNATYTYANFAKFQPLKPYELKTHIPSPEAVRALEELLDSGERLEEPFQALLTRYPALLAAATVVGGWSTYVIPKQRLGAEHVPDFLVLSINSLGPQWVAVELEAPRHNILIQDGSISDPTRHGSKQIQDWREWLTDNIAYAHNEHHLHGLTNRVPGLVVIGRDDPKAARDASRSQSGEGHRIDIHSWDWLLRHARRLSTDSLHLSEFAKSITFVDEPDRTASRSLPALASDDLSGSAEEDDDELDPWELEQDDLF